MPKSISLLAAAFSLVLITAAQAETHVLMVDGSDEYGVDRCLASGDPCGQAMATALCQANAFAEAVRFGRPDRAEITGAVPGQPACQGVACSAQVAITCSR